MASIQLSSGKGIVEVDDTDFSLVSKYRWHLSAGKYAATRVDGKRVYMHRFLMQSPNGMIIDHINGNGLDNRRSVNLRVCSHKSNIRAMHRTAPHTSAYRGVCFDKSRNKWAAKIMVNYKTINLGRFSSESEAAQIYQEAALKHFGSDFRQEVSHAI